MSKAGCPDQTGTAQLFVSCECTPLWTDTDEYRCSENGQLQQKQTSTTCPGVTEQWVNVNSTAPSISITPSSTTLCDNTVTLTVEGCVGNVHWGNGSSTTNSLPVGGATARGRGAARRDIPEHHSLTVNAPGTYIAYCEGSSGQACDYSSASVTISDGCSPPSGCDFTASASSDVTSASCRAGATLTGGCSGADCSGVNYSWSGNGISGSGITNAITLPDSSGNYTYILTLSKAGCTNTSQATALIQVSCTSCSPIWTDTNEYRCNEQGQLHRKQTSTTCPGLTEQWVNVSSTAPSITVTPSSTTLCDNNVTLTVTGCTGNVRWADGPTGDTRSVGVIGNYTAYCEGRSGQTCDYTSASAIITDGCPPPAGCDFTATATANPVSASCSSEITLMGGCAGPDCGGVSYSWSGNGMSDSTMPTTSATTSMTAGQDIYILTLSKGGCSNTSQASVSVQVNCPTCSPVWTNTNEYQCVGNQLQQKQTSTTCPGITQQWVNVDNTAPPINIQASSTTLCESLVSLMVVGCTGNVHWADGNTQVSRTVSVTGAYTAYCAGSSGQDCDYTQASVVVADGCPPPPGCDFTASASSDVSSASCSAGVTLTGNCSGTDCAGVTYAWSGNGISGSSAINPITAPPAAGNYTYTLTLGKDGCPNRTAIVQLTVNCGVVNPPQLTSVTICAEQTATLVASNCAGTVIWEGGSTGTSWITPALTQTTNFTAVCEKDGLMSAPASVTVTVIPVTRPTSVTANPYVISSAQSVTLSAIGCSDVTQWTWTSGTATGSTLVATVNQTTTFGARCVNPLGCVSDTTAFTVRYMTLAAPIISPSATFICSGQSLTLTASACDPGATVRWSNGLTGSRVIFSPSTTTEYWAICQLDSAKSDYSNRIEVRVAPGPIVSGTLSYSTGQTMSLTASAAGALSYTWYGPAGYTSTGAQLVRLAASASFAGSYAVVAHFASGCNRSATVIISVDGPVIQTQPLVPVTVCIGSVLGVPFSTTGVFGPANVFQAQLSDANGNFTAPLLMGSGTSSPLSATVPASVLPGSGYRVRVISTLPAIDGEPSATPLTVVGIPAAPTLTASATQVCSGAPVSLTAGCATGTVHWSTGATGPTLQIPALTGSQTFTALCEQSAGCSSTPASISLTDIGSLTVGQPQAICTSSLTAATGSILVSTTLSQPNALVVQYQLERQLAPGSYSVVSGWTSNSAVLSQLPADTYRLWVRGASQDVVNPTAVCGLVSYPIRIDALTAFASSYSITPGVPVSLWVEGAPFNSGQALWTNQGLQFSPSAQPQNLTATFTWEGWVKPELPLSGNNFNERYVLYPHYNGSVYSDTYAGLGIAAGTDGIRLVGHTAYYLQQILDYRTSITDWTHVAVVFTNNVASLLINGVVKASNVVPPQGKIMYPSNYLTGVPWGEYGRYHGAVDEVRLWNTARTTAEVTRDYRRLLTGQEPGLLTYWAFESITNNTALAAGSLGVSATLGGPADGYGLVSGVNANTATQTGVVSWTARPGGQIYTGPSITVSPTQSTTYTVSRSDLACQVPVAITVGPRIPCSFSLVAVATPQSLSCGQPVSLSVATSGPVSATAGVIQYDWSELSSGGLSTTVGMGTSLTALPASATLSPGISTTYNSAAGISTVYTSGTGVATYSVTATQGLCAATASVSAVLTGAPSLTISSPKAIYSEGESLTLTAGVSATTAQPLSYTWTGPSSTGALQSGPQTFTVTSQTLTVPNATTAMSGAYTVSITTVGGCTATVGLSLTVTPNSFSCTCQDCDLPTVKDTDNPPVAASNRGSAGQNFVQESVYFNAGGSSVAQTITYFDGLGRTVQKVSVGTGGKTTAVPVADVVQPMVYDALGRQPIQYLPYAVGTNNGAYRSSAASSVSGYYAGLPDKTGNAFSTIQYEASPLNRVQLQIAPGSNTPVRISYRTNTAGELPLLTYDFATHNINVVGYAAGQLYVTETTDENSHKTIEYKDKEGRVVGKDIEGLKTLYAYDDFGWLRCVVPPKASANLGGGTNFDPFAGDLLFGYDYDERGRMVRKKVPGAGITTMTYDSLDRLLTSTDANGTTITTDYDGLNRVTATRQGGTILTQTFYDGYGYGEKGFDAAHAYNQPQLSSKQGMTTGTKTLVLGTGTYLTSSTYYDNLGRVIQTASDNHKGGVDRSSMKLDYVGRSLESKLTTANSSTAITIDTRTAYEAGGRIKSVCQQVSDNQQAQPGSVGAYWEPVARHSYNGIGELTKKTLGCGIQNIDYQHQMRGWLTRMNDPADLNKGFAPADKHFFGMKLAYDGVGNISQWDYRNGQVNYAPPYDLTQKPAYQYSFTYDNLNRIKTGNLTQQGQAVFSLDNLSYDANGNIQTLNRAMGSASDALTYSYGANTNRLGGVTDNSGSAAFAQSSSYSYDANGNLITDSGKGITGIDYNYLNLPKAIHKSSGDVTYIYSASGQKLRASFPASAGSPAKVYDYIGGLVYTNNKLEFIPTAEGRILPPGLASTTVAIGSSQTVVASNQFYRYEYHLKDHLGNLRAACRCGERAVATTPSDSYAPQVVQEQHYDPFGLDLPDLGVQPGVTASRFKYNGKEEQAGLGWLDYGARLYDPAVPRWLQVDPLTDEQEAWSPYHFTYDNPINYVDLLGLSPSNISENSNIAICPTCPKGTEYDKYRDSKSLYTYDKAMGIVVNGDGKGPTVYGKKTSYDYNGLIYGSGDALIYLGNNSISTRSKLDAANSTSGTSIASQYLRQTGWGQTRTPKWLFKTLPKRVGLPFKGMSAPLRASTLGGIAGRSVPLIGRGFVAVSAGLSIYNIATAENKTETVTVEAGGWAGAWAASTAAGSALTATGIDLTGPWGWTAHGVITIGAGVSGFYGGKEVGQAVYDKTKE